MPTDADPRPLPPSPGDAGGAASGPPPTPPAHRTAFSRLIILASASWVRLALTFATGFIITPILLRALGTDLFGLLMLVSLTITASDPVMAIINKACNRELTGALSSGDGARTRRVFTNAVALSALAACVTAVLPIALAALAPLVFNYEPRHDLRVRAAILTEGSIVVVVVLTAPWSNLVLASQRMVAENASRVVSRLLDLGAVLLAVALPFDAFLAFALLRAGLQIALYVARSAWIARLVHDARFDPALRDNAMIRSMAGTGAWAFGDFVGRFGFYDADHLLLNIFRGPVYNGVYQVVNQIRGYTRLVGVSMLAGVEAIAADLHERGRIETLRRVLISSTAHSFAIVGVSCICAGAFFGPLLDCWLGKILRADPELARVMTYDDARRFAWLFLLIGLPGLLFGESHTGASSILYGMGRIRAYAPVVLAGAVVRIIVVIVLLRQGASPLVLAGVTSVGLLLIYAGYFPVLLARTVELPWGVFVWRTYGRPLLSLAPVAALAWWMSVALAPWSILKIAACCAALGALYAPFAFLFVLDGHERGRALGLLRSLPGRLRAR